MCRVSVKHNMVVLNVMEAYEHVYDRTNHVQIRFQYENLGHVT